MKCIAHRGYSLKYRDNSIESIREAILRAYDGIEIDIQLCETGEIVLFHDIYVNKRFISETSLDDLKKMGIITLQELYEQIPEIRKHLLLLDIKGSNLGICRSLENFYKDENTDNIIFCSFNRKIIYNLPQHFKIGSTFETTFHESELPILTMALNAVVCHWTCLDHDLISYCRSNDVKVYTYTHKEDEELEYMYRYDVDGIITNGF